jgi:hypothetical protein
MNQIIAEPTIIEQHGATEVINDDTKPVEPAIEKTPEQLEADKQAEIAKEAEKKRTNQERAWKRIQQEKAELKGELRAVREMLEKKQAAETNATNTAPSREQFQSDDEYINAVIEFKVDQKTKGLTEKLSQTHTESNAQTEWQKKVTEAKKEYPDYDEIVSERLELPQEAIDAVVLSPVGADLRYFLGANPDVAEKIKQMHPMRAVVEIAKIEARIEGEKATKTKPVPAKVSAAPEPIKPVGGRGGAESKDINKMTPDEYLKWRNDPKNRALFK